jgi:hypothetical protein
MDIDSPFWGMPRKLSPPILPISRKLRPKIDFIPQIGAHSIPEFDHQTINGRPKAQFAVPDRVMRRPVALREDDQQRVSALYSRHLDLTFEIAELIGAGLDANGERIRGLEGERKQVWDEIE